MESFEYVSHPSRVIFGSGTVAGLASVPEGLGLRRPLLLSTSFQIDQAEDIKSRLDGRVAGLFSEATMHTPVASMRVGRVLLAGDAAHRECLPA